MRRLRDVLSTLGNLFYFFLRRKPSRGLGSRCRPLEVLTRVCITDSESILNTIKSVEICCHSSTVSFLPGSIGAHHTVYSWAGMTELTLGRGNIY